MEDKLFLKEIVASKKEFGIRIRELRKEYGWSQEDLAGNADLTVRGISDIENGLTDVKLSSIVKMANAFGNSISELFHFENR